MAFFKLNKTDIAGKQIILEPGYSGGTIYGYCHGNPFLVSSFLLH